MQRRGVFVSAKDAADYLPNPDHLGFMAAKMLLDTPPSEHYKITYSILKPGGYADEHIHPWDHAYYVIKGKAKIKVEDDEREVGQDSLVYVPPNAKHSVRNMLNEPLVVVAVVGPESRYTVEKK